MKISISNLADVITSWTLPTMLLLGRIGPVGGGASPKYGKYNTFVTFVVLYFFITCPGRTVVPILTLNVSNDVFPPKDGPFGGRDDG